MPQMGKLEGIALGQKAVAVVMASDEALALRRHQVNAQQLLLLPVEGKSITVAVVDFCQQTVPAVEINPVAVTVVKG